MTLLEQAIVMRNAIDHMELALMGFGDLVDLPKLFEAAPPTLRLALKVDVEQMRQVCTALSELTRIVNSPEYTAKSLSSRQRK